MKYKGYYIVLTNETSSSINKNAINLILKAGRLSKLNFKHNNILFRKDIVIDLNICVSKEEYSTYISRIKGDNLLPNSVNGAKEKNLIILNKIKELKELISEQEIIIKRKINYLNDCVNKKNIVYHSFETFMEKEKDFEKSVKENFLDDICMHCGFFEYYTNNYLKRLIDEELIELSCKYIVKYNLDYFYGIYACNKLLYQLVKEKNLTEKILQKILVLDNKFCEGNKTIKSIINLNLEEPVNMKRIERTLYYVKNNIYGKNKRNHTWSLAEELINTIY